MTLDALEPFVIPLPDHFSKPLPYLDGKFDTYDVNLTTYLETENSPQQIISKTNLKYIYWGISQQIAHHTITGCSIRPGDLLGTGTISGPDEGTAGCLMELAKDNASPLDLGNNVKRAYLHDGDVVTLEGTCDNGKIFLGLGSTTSKIKPSRIVKS